MGYLPIASYAVIGNCHTAALVAQDGSQDWFCPERFDAPAVFCRLLDARQGGYFRLAPPGRFAVTRRYRDSTNVLDTVFTVDGGRVRLTDLMPAPRQPPTNDGEDAGTMRQILRLVKGLGGSVELEVGYRPTFDYARAETELSAVPAEGAVARAGRLYLTLACPGLALAPSSTGGLHARFRLQDGERMWLALAYGGDPDRAREALALPNCDEELAHTCEYWERWASKCTYRGPYRPQVLRSALPLKLLTYEPTGAVIAAPTTSLPEEIGGVRNWYYRYAWLRDASRILYALMTIGYQEEAEDFFHWLERTQRDPTAPPQIVYTIDGGRELPEMILDNLEGYRCSRPVRIGNAAAGQRQIDIYGEVLTAAELHYRAGNRRSRGIPLPEVAWTVLRGLVERAAEEWPEPDRGIWEVRGEPQLFLYSRLMCWAALDSGIRLARAYALPAPLARWSSVRDAIRQAILTHGFNPEVGAFTQAFRSTALDASVLAIPRVGFLPAADPRVRSTVERIRVELARNGLVHRYRTQDGLPGGDATFTMCSFWLVDALALGGKIDEAHNLFERVVGFANDVGPLSEEIDPVSGELLGNFPQGFTHLGLIRSAVNLAKAAKHGAEERPEAEVERARKARRAALECHSARSHRQMP